MTSLAETAHNTSDASVPKHVSATVAMTNADTSEPIISSAKPRFSPTSFMRGRRPDQFSDSPEKDSPAFEKSFFEYHLDTLTNRSDEKPFESFCRRLAQKEICPNLIPQTGPTGGGDSKVDTETYPVAEEIADRWYEGSANAASERWAFAISAKKAWQGKVRSDVAKIIDTKRGYVRIYFLSNQFIKDKDRSTIEDELTKAHGIPVRIFDRSWIVERVFERKHFDLAIEALNISVPASQKQQRTGPLDAEKRVRLGELEAQIADQSRYVGVEYQLAEDCLSAAILSRELELSRIEIDGRFDRAERVAQKAGAGQQQSRIKYERAWTACYWFDDLETANRLYDEIESLVLPGDQATDLERLTNAWTIIATGATTGLLSEGAAKLVERTARLKNSLLDLSKQTERPNNAAHARGLLYTIELTETKFVAHEAGRILKQFAQLFRDTENLGGFPFDQYAHFFEEIGTFLGSNPEYDAAFEVLLPILERRRSEGAAGKALLARGMQKLDAGDHYEAIRLLGRAQQKLIKHEHRDDLSYCLLVCARAYWHAGLLWAAHASLLAAASLSLHEFVTEGRIELRALRAVQQLVWTALQLGRVPHVLRYIHFQYALAMQMQFDEQGKELFKAQFDDQDRVLAMLLLRASIKQLRAMECLPRSLEGMGLFAASGTLLFALGHIDTLLREGYVAQETGSEAIADMFARLAELPGNESLPPRPEVFDQSPIVLTSMALGCQWRVTVDANETAIRIAEAFLGFVETFFATSLSDDAIPRKQHIDIRIVPTAKTLEAGHTEFSMVLDDPEFMARFEYSPAYDPKRELVDRKLQSFLHDTLAVLIPRVLHVPDLAKYFERIAKAEDGFGRSLTFADIFTSASNVLGTSPVYLLDDWLDTKERFVLQRTEAVRFGQPTEGVEPGQLKFGVGDPPPELLKATHLKHGQRRVLSVIDIDLWEAARWRGIGIMPFPDFPPGVAFLFENEKDARRIFADWAKQFGERDEDDIIRISLITGVDKARPAAYVAALSTNVEKLLKTPQPFEQAVTISRAKMMEPPDKRSLEMLVSAYKQFKCYFIAPAVLDARGGAPEMLRECAIFKRQLNIRAAWEIGEHDPDTMALGHASNPIIPEGVIDPPVNKALERLRKMRRRAVARPLGHERHFACGGNANSPACDLAIGLMSFTTY